MKKMKQKLKLNNEEKDAKKYEERLMHCAETGDTTKLRSTLTRKSVSCTKPNEEGKTALHQACALGSRECLEIMLENDPDLSVTDSLGRTVVHLAASGGHTSCVEVLINKGCSVNNEDNSGMTALHCAVNSGDIACAKAILKVADLKDPKDKEGRTPLMLSVSNCDSDMMKFLIDAGTDVNAQDSNDSYSLMHSVLSGSVCCAEVLIESGADLNLLDSSKRSAHALALERNDQAMTILLSTVTKSSAKTESFNGSDADDKVGEKRTKKEKKNKRRTSSGNSGVFDELPLSSQREAVENVLTKISRGRQSYSSTSSALSPINFGHISNHSSFSEQDNAESHDTISQRSIIEADDWLLRETALEIKLRDRDSRLESCWEEIDYLKSNLVDSSRAKIKLEDEVAVLRQQLQDFQNHNKESPSMDRQHSTDDQDPLAIGSSLMTAKQLEQIESLQSEVLRLNEELREISNDKEVLDSTHVTLEARYSHLEQENNELARTVDDLNEQIALLRERSESKPELTNGGTRILQEHPFDDNERLPNAIKKLNNEHQKLINVYRNHLLALIQGEMEPSIYNTLQQIVDVRSQAQFL